MNVSKVYRAAHHLHQITLFLDYAYQKDLRREKGPFDNGTHFDHITRNILALLYSYCEMIKLKDAAAEIVEPSVKKLVTSLNDYLHIVGSFEKIRIPEMTTTDGILGTRLDSGFEWHDLLLDRVTSIMKYAEKTILELEEHFSSDSTLNIEKERLVMSEKI